MRGKKSKTEVPWTWCPCVKTRDRLVVNPEDIGVGADEGDVERGRIPRDPHGSALQVGGTGNGIQGRPKTVDEGGRGPDGIGEVAVDGGSGRGRYAGDGYDRQRRGSILAANGGGEEREKRQGGEAWLHGSGAKRDAQCRPTRKAWSDRGAASISRTRAASAAVIDVMASPVTRSVTGKFASTGMRSFFGRSPL